MLNGSKALLPRLSLGIEISSSINILELFSDKKEAVEICLELGKKFPEVLGYSDSVNKWVDLALNGFKSSKFPDLQVSFNKIDEHLKLRTFLIGNSITLADAITWAALKSVPVWNKNFKDANKAIGSEIYRWFAYLGAQEPFARAQSMQQEEAAKLKEKKKDQGSFEIGLENAEMGKVVTRFPPEPSGYLHIGHAKAALLNEFFAKKYQGKLLLRFDDTNPTKEKCEFEESIIEDLALLGIKGDSLSHTSDYFDQLYDLAIKMIQAGLAYCDDTPLEQMRAERFDGIPSKNRDNSVEENLRRFEEMKQGTEFGLTNCVRAKIDMKANNKALRDPVMYRCNLTPHHRVDDKWKIYPTYDFACPVVDSIEGVTHALRTDEYHDRNDQYYWFIDALKLRKPFIWDYSRLSFIFTFLSKRKLTWFVNSGRVTGWDDPRFPTVRGIRRRGMTVDALREYILMQGASKNAVMLEWDKIWAVNKRIIDPVSPRYVALNKENLCKVILTDGPKEAYTSKVPRHKKNTELGEKETSYSDHLFIEHEDAATLEVSEEITLMDWGNVIIEDVQRESNNLVVQVIAKLHLEGDFKKTKKKLTWLSPDPAELISVDIHDYDYLITKKKLEEEDNLEDCLTPVTEFVTHAIGDANLASLQKGDIIQLERKGFFICDRPHSAESRLQLITIPDGKAKSIGSKHAD